MANTLQGRSIVPQPTVRAPRVNVSAQKSPELTGLLDRHTKHLDRLEAGKGRNMEIAGTKMRDLREGMRKQFGSTRGRTPAQMAAFDAETQRSVVGGEAKMAMGATDLYGKELRGGKDLAEAPSKLALEEKKFGLDMMMARDRANHEAWARERERKQDEFNNWAMMLQAHRSSPIYTGV